MKALDFDAKQGCLALANELASGPALFDEFGKPTEAVLRYTGARLLENTERCLVVGALKLLACSDRQIADAVKCDVRSIPLMLAEAEKTGRIPALKDRLTRLTGLNAERAQIALAELLERATGNVSVEMAAMVKAVATAGGINTQNLQLLTGGATEIIETRVGTGRAEIERWWREVVVDVTPVDGPSTGMAQIVAETGAKEGRDTTGDTQAASSTGPAETGGGGRLDGGAATADGSIASKILMEVARE